MKIKNLNQFIKLLIFQILHSFSETNRSYRYTKFSKNLPYIKNYKIKINKYLMIDTLQTDSITNNSDWGFCDKNYSDMHHLINYMNVLPHKCSKMVCVYNLKEPNNRTLTMGNHLTYESVFMLGDPDYSEIYFVSRDCKIIQSYDELLSCLNAQPSQCLFKDFKYIMT